MLVLNGSASIADVVALADRHEQVSVSTRVVEAVDHAHRVAADLSTRLAIYGRTTGVGANRTTSGIADRHRIRHATASQPRGRRRGPP